MKQFKRHRDYGFFDQDIRLSKLEKLGDPLQKLDKHVDFEIFRNILEDVLTKLAKGKGGRRPYDYVLLFKILILQRYYNLSDDQMEYQINDRMSFMRFLNLTIADDIPDSKTIWNFREQLVDLHIIEPLFHRFTEELARLGLLVHEGRIVDASFVEVPRQRNKKDENVQIKEGTIPESFKENPHKRAQKDTDARWTQKNGMNFYGYKNHVKADKKSKFIVTYHVTDASVHDSQSIENLLDSSDRNQNLYADSAYTGHAQQQTITEMEMVGQICEKGYRNRPLTETQKESNREKSRIRSRVEHIFGFMENSMNGMGLKAIGHKRIEGLIGLTNLTYNLFRKVQLCTI
jgi:transposase, IS5 family